MPTSVLFVCMGNICRSPTAHGVFQAMVKEKRLQKEISVDSAGTGAWHVDAAPDKRAIQVASKEGYNLKKLKARLLVPEDLERFDYVIGMDSENLAIINDMKPARHSGHTGLLLDYATDIDYQEVPDPYYGGTKGFELVLELVQNAAAGLLAHIEQHDLKD